VTEKVILVTHRAATAKSTWKVDTPVWTETVVVLTFINIFTISRRAHFVTLLTFALIATKCINTCLRLFAVMHSTIGTLIYVFAICLGLLVAGTTLAGITSDLVDTCPTWATPIRIGSALINISTCAVTFKIPIFANTVITPWRVYTTLVISAY
jgi:hypothetical protein